MIGYVQTFHKDILTSSLEEQPNTLALCIIIYPTTCVKLYAGSTGQFN